MFLRIAANGPCYTTLRDGVPVVIGGVLPTHRGNGTAWQVDTGEVQAHPRLHLALARNFLEMAEWLWGIWRIEATCEVGNEAAVRWLERLGFTREGCKRSFIISGDQHWLYARIRSGGQACS